MRIRSIPREVVRTLTSLRPLVCADGAYWEWTGTHWQQLRGSVDTWLELMLRPHSVYSTTADGSKKTVDTSSQKFGAGLSAFVRRSSDINRPDFFADAPRGLTVSNGFLALADDGRPSLLPHKPDHRSRYFLDTTYNPEAHCPYTLEILGSYFTRDRDDDGAGKQRAILEFLALCLFGQANANRRGVILWVTGEKGSGKSTVIEALVDCAFDRAMVGSVEPHKFGDPTERFRLVGKLINFKDEIESRAVRDVGTVKAVVSGSEVSIKQLYRDLGTARLISGHLLVANEMSVLADSSGALHDRVIRIHFTHPYDRPYEHPPTIARKIRAERAGFLNLLCKVYREMLERGEGAPLIEVPRSAVQRQRESALEADALRMFIQECVVYDDKGRVRAATVLQNYNRWRQISGIKREADAAEIARKLCEVMPEARPPKSSSSYKQHTWYRVGFRALEEELSVPPRDLPEE